MELSLDFLSVIENPNNIGLIKLQAINKMGYLKYLHEIKYLIDPIRLKL